MDNDKYRSLLLKLAQEIREDELKAMKFMCTGNLTRRQLEDVEDTHDLWTKLEEADKISHKKMQFLKKLLQEGCKNRAVLIEIFTIYTETNVMNSANPQGNHGQNITIDTRYIENLQKLQQEIDLIVKEIGRDWRSLARKLGLIEADIDCIAEAHRSNLREQCRSMLKQWVHRHNEEKKDIASKTDLIIALQKCEKKALANKVSNLY